VGGLILSATAPRNLPSLYKRFVRKMSEISCGSIWGIGRRTTEKLTKAGIHTVEDLTEKDVSYFRDHFGVVGERMHMELTGVPVYGVGENDDAV